MTPTISRDAMALSDGSSGYANDLMAPALEEETGEQQGHHSSVPVSDGVNEDSHGAVLSWEVRVAIADDALPFPFQRDCFSVNVREGDTVNDVVAEAQTQTVCFWAESSVNVFCAWRDGAWLSESQAHKYGARESFCGHPLGALNGTADVLELLGGVVHVHGIVHLVIQLRSSSQAGAVHRSMWTKIKMFKRCRLDDSFALMGLRDIGVTGVVPVNVASLHRLNTALPSLAAFPSRLCWRRAEHHVFSILTEKISTCVGDLSALSLALVGSPGVGKSTIAQMLAWHVSHSFQLDVVHLHKARPGLVVFKFFTARRDLVCGEVDEDVVPQLVATLARAEGRFIKPFVIVDGFQDQPKISFLLSVISGPFDGTPCSQCTVLLPSWSQRDVDAIVEAMEKPHTVSERYELYGGNLRCIFAEDQDAAKAFHHITKWYIPDSVLRRFAVRNPENRSSYQDASCWIGHVESSPS